MRDVSRHVTVNQLYDLYSGNAAVFDSLRPLLRRFAKSNVLLDGPSSAENIRDAVTRLMAGIQPIIDSCVQVSGYRAVCV